MFRLFLMVVNLSFWATSSAAPWRYYLSWDAFIPELEYHTRIHIVNFDDYGDPFYYNTLGVANLSRVSPLFNYVELDLNRIYRSRIHPNFIVLHEYLHLMYIDHVDVNGYFEDGCTKYLMNTSFGRSDSNVECWHRYKDHYMDQFYNWKHNCNLIPKCNEIRGVLFFKGDEND